MNEPYILKKAVHDYILEELNQQCSKKSYRLWSALFSMCGNSNPAFIDDDELDDWYKALNSDKTIINPQTDKERFKNIMKGRRKGTFKGMDGFGIFVPADDFDFIASLAKKELDRT